jgi:hypothetical protein
VWIFLRAVKEFREIVNSRGERLRRLSIDELLDLSDLPTEHLRVRSRSATISIIVEPQPNGSMRVVVQGFMNHLLFPSMSVALDGFFKHPDGSVSPMPEGDFYSYD